MSQRPDPITALRHFQWQLWGKATDPVPRGSGTGLGLVSHDTDSFRTLCSTLQPTDVVVEIGCSYGVATQALAKHLGENRVLGVDISKEALEHAAARAPGVKLLLCDALSSPHVLLESITELVAAHPDGDLVVLVDVGGNRELEALAALLPWVAGLRARPRCIIVKSEALHAAARARATVACPPPPPSHAPRHELKEGEVHEAVTFEWDAILHDARRAVESRRGVAVARHPHPLKAPLRLNAEGVPICRYHNFSRRGCMTKDRAEAACELDHAHCHYCRQAGHVALDCPEFEPLI